MNLALIGDRGHQEYVFEGLQWFTSNKREPVYADLQPVHIVAISPGTEKDDIKTLYHRCKEHGQEPKIFTDYRQLLDQSNIDSVSIAGPFEQHTTMSIEAFQCGYHVLCEKPVSTRLEDLDRLKNEYSHSENIVFMSMMGLRYDPAFYTAWQAVTSGAVGVVCSLYAQKSYKLGSRPAYYAQRETYGGTIPWVGSHAIDWVYWFSRAAFQSVFASQSRQFNKDQGDLEVSAQCLFELEHEICATISLDYFRPQTASTHGDDRIRVVGTEGVIEVRQGKVVLINSQAEGEQHLSSTCHRQIFCDFVAQVEGKQKALIPAEDIFTVTEACLIAQQSADEGRELHFRR